MGKCGLCGKDLHPVLGSCPPCAEKANQRLRAKKGYKPKVAGGPGRPKKILDQTGTKATTDIELKMSKANYSLSNRALSQDLGVSRNTVGKYRKIYGDLVTSHNVTEVEEIMSKADYSLSNKELAFSLQVSLPTIAKFRKKYASNTKP